ncbi:hypothetical protein NKH77_17210 [Streptomyces sp. M19]
METAGPGGSGTGGAGTGGAAEDRLPVPVPLYGSALDGDLPQLYERMRREHGPVVPVALQPGLDAWLVLGYRELLHLTRDEQHFSHDPRLWTALRDGRVAADSPLMPMVGWRPALLFHDGAQHRRMRAAVSDALNRIDGHRLIRTVREAAEEIIAGFADRHRAELMTEYVRRLPVHVIVRLLGIAETTGAEIVDAISATVFPRPPPPRPTSSSSTSCWSW